MFELRLQGSRGPLPLDVQVKMTAPWTVLFGESGAGKSSILRALAGLWQPRVFSFKQKEEDLSTAAPQQRRCALLTHHASLAPHFTARQNVAFVSNADRADALLKQFHADHLAHKFPAQLSVGEQQRVAIARAVASKPRALLLDEAFNGLDLALRDELAAQLKATQLPILAVTHDVAEATVYGDECILLQQGKVTAQGSPRSVLRDHIRRLQALLAD